MKKITRNILIGFAIGFFILVSYIIISNFNLLIPKDNSSPEFPENISLTKKNLLESACQNAINDYPSWTETNFDLVIWNTPEEKFYFRKSPDGKVTSVDSPAQNPKTLADMDFIGTNEIIYVAKTNSEWEIGSFKLKGLEPPEKSIIYSKTESISNIDISPISKNEFVIFYEKENKAFLNTNKKTLLETSVASGNEKLAVSPSENYVYFLYGNILRIFDIELNEKIKEINSVKDAVWIGNNYLIYSTSSGSFIYGIQEKESQKIEKLDSVSDLTFNPSGIIAYTEGDNAKVNDCQTWEIIGSKQNGRLETLTSDTTAIMQNAESFGYWKFKDADWTITFIEDNSDVSTTWSRY